MSICSILAYIFSMTLAVGFAARPKNDNVILDTASLASWMASEPGSTEKAQAPLVPADSRTIDQRSSIDGYAWSRSAQSTIPSKDSPPGNENGVKEHAPQIKDQFDKDKAPILRSSSRQHNPPPANNVPRKYDDVSTLTWDPGY